MFVLYTGCLIPPSKYFHATEHNGAIDSALIFFLFFFFLLGTLDSALHGTMAVVLYFDSHPSDLERVGIWPSRPKSPQEELWCSIFLLQSKEIFMLL